MADNPPAITQVDASDRAPGSSSLALTLALTSARMRRYLYATGMVMIVATICAGLIEPLLTVHRYVAIDPNEGWNAYFDETAMNKGVLYPSADSRIANNYPPLSFYIVGAAGRIVGDPIFAGRWIALAALLSVAISIFAWLRKTGSTVGIAAFGAGAFLVSAVTYAPNYVGMDDPQWLAHAVMMIGLLVLSRTLTVPLLISCGLMVVAGWTKHLLLPLPLAVGAWLFWHSRSAFIKWAMCALCLCLIGAALAHSLYGMSFFEGLFVRRLYSARHALTFTAKAVRIMAPVLALSLLGVFRTPRTDRSNLVALYLGIAIAVALFSAGGAGVDVNAFFDLIIAASLASALGLEALKPCTHASIPRAESSRYAECAGFGGGSLAAAAIFLFGACEAAYAATLAPAVAADIRRLDAEERTALAGIERLRSTGEGRAACEDATFCYWSGQRFEIDFFLFGQKLKTGALDASACNSALNDVSIIVLQPGNRPGSPLLPDQCNEAIYRQFHEIAWDGPGRLLVHGSVPRKLEASASFDRHRFRQVSRPVDIAAAL